MSATATVTPARSISAIDAAGVVGVALRLPLDAIERRRLDPPTGADAALAAVVRDRARLVLARRRHGVGGVGDRDRVVRDRLVGVVHVVIGAVLGAVQAAVDRQRAALVDRERTLIEMHVRPVVVAGLEGDVGRVRGPVAARHDQPDAVEHGARAAASLNASGSTSDGSVSGPQGHEVGAGSRGGGRRL